MQRNTRFGKKTEFKLAADFKLTFLKCLKFLKHMFPQKIAKTNVVNVV